VCSIFGGLSPQESPTLVKVETIMIYDKFLSGEECAPEVELKFLPSTLRYKFLGLNSTYSIIVNARVSASQVDSSLRVLRSHHKAIWCTLDVPKGIHLLCACIVFWWNNTINPQLNLKEG